MKLFLLKTGFLAAPPLLLFLALEVYISTYPGAMKAKAEYIKTNTDVIEVVFLGLSHVNAAVNPEWLPFPAANLAMGGQALNLDYQLLEKYIDRLPRLRIVVVGLTYPSLEAWSEAKYWRNAMYYRYHGINNFGRSLRSADFFLFLSNPDFYIEWVKQSLIGSSPLQDMNPWGFHVRTGGPFRAMEYDDARIKAWAEDQPYGWHPEIDDQNYVRNRALLKKMTQRCVEQGIQLVYVNTPMHETYRDRMLQEKIERRRAVERELAECFPEVVFLDYEAHPNFDARHFYDESHVNADGAKLFTDLLEKKLSLMLEANRNRAGPTT